MYNAHKEWYKTIHTNNHSNLIHDSSNDLTYDNERNRQYLFLLKQLSSIHTILDVIEERYGTEAKVIIYKQFICNEKQITLSQQYGYSLRTLQRRIYTWLYTALMEKQYDQTI